jgi:hypothetical protein
MWNILPRALCDQHLRGEHLECHMFVGAIRHGKSLTGYVAKGLVDTSQLKFRHDQLAQEMLRRGWNHFSLLETYVDPQLGTVSPQKSLRDLKERCPKCRALIKHYYGRLL